MNGGPVQPFRNIGARAQDPYTFLFSVVLLESKSE